MGHSYDCKLLKCYQYTIVYARDGYILLRFIVCTEASTGFTCCVVFTMRLSSMVVRTGTRLHHLHQVASSVSLRLRLCPRIATPLKLYMSLCGNMYIQFLRSHFNGMREDYVQYKLYIYYFTRDHSGLMHVKTVFEVSDLHLSGNSPPIAGSCTARGPYLEILYNDHDCAIIVSCTRHSMQVVTSKSVYEDIYMYQLPKHYAPQLKC